MFSYSGFALAYLPLHSRTNLFCFVFFLTSAEYKITKKFEVESEEEKKKITESFSVIFENFTREKEVTEFTS